MPQGLIFDSKYLEQKVKRVILSDFEYVTTYEFLDEIFAQLGSYL